MHVEIARWISEVSDQAFRYCTRLKQHTQGIITGLLGRNALPTHIICRCMYEDMSHQEIIGCHTQVEQGEGQSEKRKCQS